MSSSQSAEKLRVDIKRKLESLGANVDDELPDYILLMLANQRTKYQVKDELSLFLQADTNDFVDWLYEKAKNVSFKKLSLKSSASSSSSNSNSKKPIEKEAVTSTSKSTSSSETRRVVNSKESSSTRKSDESPTRRSKKVAGREYDSSNEKKRVVKTAKRRKERLSPSHQPDVYPSIDSLEKNPYSRSLDNDAESVKHEEYSPQPVVRGSEIQDEQEVELHLRSDANETDELLEETIEEPVFELDKDERPKPPIRTGRERKPQLHRNENYGPSSTIGAIVRGENPHESGDDDEDTEENCYNVSSIVRVTERKSSVPKNLQASSKLVLKAMQDANNSIGRESLKRRLSEDLDVPYTPTPIKRRLGPRVNHGFENKRYQPEYFDGYMDEEDVDDPRNYYEDEEMERSPIRQNPRFIVTLDGAHKLPRKDRFDDELILDEEMEEEFQENDDSYINRNRDMQGSDSGRVKERCKYWPSCKNGNRCLYIHPSSPCRTFPNCKFGDKCLFVHPDCKFDAVCTRKDCPYTHSAKRGLPLVPVVAPTLCRYNSNCMNPTCPFVHPKPCNFGAHCRNPTCPFSHPPSFNAFKTLPRPHQLKWKSSERKFEEGQTEPMPVEVEQAES